MSEAAVTLFGINWLIMYRASRPLVVHQLQRVHCNSNLNIQYPYVEGKPISDALSVNLYHAVPIYSVSVRLQAKILTTHAIMFTLCPWAFFAIVSLSFAALNSIDPEGGTLAVMTLTALSSSAFTIPRQY